MRRGDDAGVGAGVGIGVGTGTWTSVSTVTLWAMSFTLCMSDWVRRCCTLDPLELCKSCWNSVKFSCGTLVTSIFLLAVSTTDAVMTKRKLAPLAALASSQLPASIWRLLVSGFKTLAFTSTISLSTARSIALVAEFELITASASVLLMPLK